MFEYRMRWVPDPLYDRPAPRWALEREASGDWIAVRGALRVRLSPRTTPERAESVRAALARAYGEAV